MSVAELAKVIGKTGTLAVDVSGGEVWYVPVSVVDVRQSWGEVQYQVAPSGGAGALVWVKSYRVTLCEGVK